MGVGAVRNVRCRRKKFTFAVSSPDECLLKFGALVTLTSLLPVTFHIWIDPCEQLVYA